MPTHKCLWKYNVHEQSVYLVHKVYHNSVLPLYSRKRVIAALCPATNKERGQEVRMGGGPWVERISPTVVYFETDTHGSCNYPGMYFCHVCDDFTWKSELRDWDIDSDSDDPDNFISRHQHEESNVKSAGKA